MVDATNLNFALGISSSMHRYKLLSGICMIIVGIIFAGGVYWEEVAYQRCLATRPPLIDTGVPCLQPNYSIFVVQYTIPGLITLIVGIWLLIFGLQSRSIISWKK
ncbi:MAG: hypothetical protein HMLIMOIP_002533 [Candidatus Nitrosomirales archaeon]|jgi:hypothetical protein